MIDGRVQIPPNPPLRKGGIWIALSLFLIMLVAIVLVAGCGETPSEESQNISAILSPDGSRIAFIRSFRYYFNKASVLDPSGWEDSVFEETSIYIMDRSTGELIKLLKVDTSAYGCNMYSCFVNISWEGDVIAYSVRYGIHVLDLDGNNRGFVDFSRGKSGSSVPFTLSGDAVKLFYLGRHPTDFDRHGLYSIGLDGTGESYIADLKHARYYDIRDMIWDSARNSILVVERPYDSKEPVVWRLTTDGDWVNLSEQGLMEYQRRRLGGWESNPPFSELEELTRGISHAEWDVPAPDEFD